MIYKDMYSYIPILTMNSFPAVVVWYHCVVVWYQVFHSIAAEH